MSAEAVRVVEQIQDALTMGDVVAGLDDDEATNGSGELLAELAEPDFEVVMVGPATPQAASSAPGSRASAKPGSIGRARSRATGSISSA